MYTKRQKSNSGMNKKGISIWISWILIIAFIVSLGVFMFLWTTSATESATSRLKEIHDSVDCNFVSLSIDSICQNTQTLNMNITNRKNIDIDHLILKIYDIYGNPEPKELEKFIRHGETNTENVIVIKQGVTSYTEIVPVVIKNNKRIICNEKKVSINNIKFC